MRRSSQLVTAATTHAPFFSSFRFIAPNGIEWIDLFRQHSDACGKGSFHAVAGLHRAHLPADRVLQQGRGGQPPAPMTPSSHSTPSMPIMSPSDEVDTTSDPRTVVVRYAFPHRLRAERGSDEVSLATILAIFDEVSSWAFFTADRTRRPGVSVHLSADARWDCVKQASSSTTQTAPPSTPVSSSSTSSPSGTLKGDLTPSNQAGYMEHYDIIEPPRVGEEYEIVSTVHHSGRTLGFVDIELLRVRPQSPFRRFLGSPNRSSLDSTGATTKTKPQEKSILSSPFAFDEPYREVLVTGRHIKFLPMPKPIPLLSWDAIFSNPVLEMLTANFMRRQIANCEQLREKHRQTLENTGKSQTKFLLDHSFDSVETWFNDMKGDESAEENAPSRSSFSSNKDSTLMTIRCGHEHRNPLGTTHGGCQVMFAAEAAKAALKGCSSGPQEEVVWTLGNSLDLEQPTTGKYVIGSIGCVLVTSQIGYAESVFGKARCVPKGTLFDRFIDY